MLDLVVERGLHDAPMSLLAQRSGASPGIIYHYFASKDELIEAVYQRIASQKREALLGDFSASQEPRETLLRLWLNAYTFYRAHQKEVRFLDQYLNSPLCKSQGDGQAQPADPAAVRILEWMRPRSQGGLLKELPAVAIQSMTLGLAMQLAKAQESFAESTLRAIAETVWNALVAD